MLESLELEYRREEDWCGGHDKLGSMAETDHVSPLINKHLEQKEAFLKVHLTHTQTQTPAITEAHLLSHQFVLFIFLKTASAAAFHHM